MTRSISSANYTSLQNRVLIARDFIWFVVRDRSTGAPVTDGYWSDLGSISADVIDPDTGSIVTRTFASGAGLVSVSAIPLVSNLTVQTVTVKLSQVSDRVNDLIRGYDCKQGKVQVFRGMFDPTTRAMVAPAIPRFAGTIDTAPIKTPPEGEIGDVTLTCTGNTQELMRSNPDTRSDASQRLRDSIDEFYRDTATVIEWQIYWGKKSGTIDIVGASRELIGQPF
ncbi:hypothetical protein LQG66_03805 [Bradyrhizobium ontarionense]|uniref:Uncharacterized protein n=1 Tax=Bradyrhizobium ontarionense TaxID=2898149 RepID=A0ABY3RDU8_9BRAD|nr:hypothetical protein [Bradyrhizobium sp. A19]UFZ05451.1 hypothetical protein LQG66_03805 [Bradyrhizobium sp. A19]